MKKSYICIYIFRCLYMEFKKLEVGQEGGWFRRAIRSRHTIKTIIAIGVGAVAGFLYFYFTQGQQVSEITAGDIVKSILIGGFFGFFITNSPCSRGRC